MGEGRKIAIVGFAETHRDQAPFSDPSFQIWGSNHLWPYIPRWDVWFDMHDPAWSASHLDPKVWEEHEAWLRKDHGKPIYMLQQHPQFPSSTAYPLEYLRAAAGFRPYFTNGIAYQIALALHEGVTELHLYGVDMRHDSEYGAQRPSVMYWLGRAESAGVKVVVPDTCALFDEPLYGYTEAAGAWAELERAALERRTQVVAKRKEWADRQEEAVAHLHAYDGVIQECDYWVRRARQRARGGVL